MSTNLELKFIDSKWDNILKVLKSNISNESFFNEFISSLKVSELNDNNLYLECKNLFAKQTLDSDFKGVIKKVIDDILGTNIELYFITKGDEKPQSESTPLRAHNKNINSKYTFNNFIVSHFNKQAHNAAKSIFTKMFWNPIFISGGVGLGKTHLLHAIGNEYIKVFPHKNIKYVTSDDFIREVYGALSNGNNLIEGVKDKYQDCDLLMIDDIQFLAKKDKINEIFFNIFNHNVANEQIIIMTSDKPPQELDFFEDRMKSRFVSGLMIKIDRPDLNSIKNILKDKINEVGEHFTFTDDALNYIVHRNTNDIRRLEGFLHRILFFAINNLPPSAIINVNTIQQILDKDQEGLIKDVGYDVDPNYVIQQVCKSYGVDSDLVKSKIRSKQISQARHICMYVLRNKFNMTFSQIGSYFSGRNYTTVMEGVVKIERSLKMDDGLKNFITLLYKKL